MSGIWLTIALAACIVASCCIRAVADDSEPSLAVGNFVFSTDEVLLAEAENAMINYANARDELLAQSACYVRGDSWSFSNSGGMQRIEHIFVGARDENAAAIKSDSPHFYYAHGVRMVQSSGGKRDYSGQLGFTIWDQFVRQNNDTFYRRGAGNNPAAASCSAFFFVKHKRTEVERDYQSVAFLFTSAVFRVVQHRKTVHNRGFKLPRLTRFPRNDCTPQFAPICLRRLSVCVDRFAGEV